MTKLSEASRQCGISIEEITLWVEEGWIVPQRRPKTPKMADLDDADLARLRLIADLTGRMGIDREAVPVILHLIDQLYAMRRRMTRLAGALETLPEGERRELLTILKRESDR